MKYIVYTLAFVVELLCWFGLASFGFQAGNTRVTKWLIAVAIVFVVITFWGLCMSPNAPYRLPFAYFYIAKIALYSLSAGALWRYDKRLAVVFIVLILLSEPWLVHDERALSRS